MSYFTRAREFGHYMGRNSLAARDGGRGIKFRRTICLGLSLGFARMRMRPMRFVAMICLAAGALVGAWGATPASGKRSGTMEAGPARPALPAIESIALEPASLVLADGRDGRQVLVWGLTKEGQKFDLTDEAVLKAETPHISIVDGRYVYPAQVGEGAVTITANGKQAKLAVKVQKVERPPVRFGKEVMPVLASVGCNAGTCHGSAKGRNGFKLSLRGYDMDYDYHALANDLLGRRVNKARPEESLMLLKPIGAVPHEGGKVLRPGSRQYDLIYQWIKEG